MLDVDRVLEVHDALIVWIGDGQGKVHTTRNALIGSGASKRLPVEYVFSGIDFNPDDTGLQAETCTSQEKKDGGKASK
ncbi:MAG: hypothetical protein WCA37_06535 [Terracidiphilus sp.]